MRRSCVGSCNDAVGFRDWQSHGTKVRTGTNAIEFTVIGLDQTEAGRAAAAGANCYEDVVSGVGGERVRLLLSRFQDRTCAFGGTISGNGVTEVDAVLVRSRLRLISR